MKKRTLWLIGIIGWLWIVSWSVSAQETSMNLNIANGFELVGGHFIQDQQNHMLTATADGPVDPTLLLGTQSVTAHAMTFSQNANILYATGNVRVWDGGEIMHGDRLDYNTQTNEGTLHGLKSSELMSGVFFTGERLFLGHRPSKIPKDATEAQPTREYTLIKGTLTTNDLPAPFYHIEYDRLVFAPGVRATGYNAVFVSGNTPMMYVPILTKSLAEHELVYFVNVDSYSELGWAWMNRLMWRPSDQYVFNFYGDYFSKAGFSKGAKINLNIPGEYGPRAMFYGNHIKQEAPDNDRIFDGKDRYSFSVEYAEKLPYDMFLSAKGHMFSDSEYRWDYRGPESGHDIDLLELEQDSVSHLNLSKWWDNQSLRITLASRLDPFYYSGLPYVEREPQLHFEQYPTALFGTGLFADMQLDYGRYRREEGVTYPLNENQLYDQTTFYDEVDRMDAEMRLGYPFHLPGRWTLKPWAGYRVTYYADPMQKSGTPLTPYEYDDEVRSMPEGGIDISTRTTYEFDPFLDRYERMRAVVEPMLQYGYFNPDNNLENITTGATDSRFPYIDPVDEFRFKMHRLSAMLHSRIQGKDKGGATSDFMRLSTGIQYDIIPDDNLRYDSFEYYEDFANHNDYRFSDLVEDFGIYPYEWLTFGNTLRYDIDDNEIRSSYTYTTVQPIDPVHFSLGYLTFRHPVLDTSEQRDVTFNMNWKMSNKWYLYYTTWYDIDDQTFRRNHIGVVRDMYDFYGTFQVGYRKHPTLGDEFKFSVGLQFWGFGKKKTQVTPVLFY